MTISSTPIEFESFLFKIIPEEDSETNPGLYGMELAQRLKDKLTARGYVDISICAEDWGRCLIVDNEKYLLAVGIGCLQSVPTLQWNIFCFLEYRLFSSLFLSKELKCLHYEKYKKLVRVVEEIIYNDKDIRLLLQ